MIVSHLHVLLVLCYCNSVLFILCIVIIYLLNNNNNIDWFCLLNYFIIIDQFFYGISATPSGLFHLNDGVLMAPARYRMSWIAELLRWCPSLFLQLSPWVHTCSKMIHLSLIMLASLETTRSWSQVKADHDSDGVVKEEMGRAWSQAWILSSGSILQERIRSIRYFICIPGLLDASQCDSGRRVVMTPRPLWEGIF